MLFNCFFQFHSDQHAACIKSGHSKVKTWCAKINFVKFMLLKGFYLAFPQALVEVS